MAKMTEGMIAMLKKLDTEGGQYACTASPDVARLVALAKRGLVYRPHNPGGRWNINDAGRAALKEME